MKWPRSSIEVKWTVESDIMVHQEIKLAFMIMHAEYLHSNDGPLDFLYTHDLNIQSQIE